MAVVRLPSLLAEQAGGQKEWRVEAATVEQALRKLPIADLLFDETGVLRPLVNVYVDGEDARDRGGLASTVGADADVRVVAAVAGG
jgi:hypothetical protein